MKITSSIAVVGVLLAGSAAQAQLVGAEGAGNPQASWNTASSGTMALRAPGNMVALGRADFRESHAQSIVRARFGPPVEAEAPEGPTLGQQVRIEIIETMFDNLNASLLVLLNAIRASGGLPPLTPGAPSADLSDLLGHITNAG